MRSFFNSFPSFPKTFWAANTIELFERWAYYGVFNLLALYLTNSKESGALGFTQTEKGLIMGIVNAILYFLPIITGAIADKFGYKRVLILAFIILSSGYFLMGEFTGFTAVFLCFLYVATGAALFKPVVSATIAKTTNQGNASLGFGIFYMIINIGGLIGPLVASELRETGWNKVFLMSSLTILLNLILVILFFKDPSKPKDNESLAKNLRQVFSNIFSVLSDLKFTAFLIIIIGAWTVYWQYFYSLPVFIEQWSDTGRLYNWLNENWSFMAKFAGNDQGLIPAEKIIALDAFFIILFQILISSLIAKLNPLKSMVWGILLNGAGLFLAFLTHNPFFLLGSILLFGIGEMAYSPKILEYIGRIAPVNKEGLYMGTQFVPIAAGNFLGGYLAGPVFEAFADKYTMIRKMLLIPEETQIGNKELLELALQKSGFTEPQLNNYLWGTYQPYHFAFVLLSITVITVIVLIMYNLYQSKTR